MKTAAILLLALAAAAQPPNTLTRQETREGWVLLFDGRTFQHWRDPSRLAQPGYGWEIRDGSLHAKPHSRLTDDLLTVDSFSDFDLQFEFRLSPGGNSGIKYRIQHVLFVDDRKITPGPGGFEGYLGRETTNPLSDRATIAPASTGSDYTIGFEYQILDNERHPDAKGGPDRQAGALYRMIPPTQPASKPVGEWNQGRLIVRGQHVEHWLNGVKVVDGNLTDPQVQDGIRQRWAPAPAIRTLLLRPMPDGPLGLQHHGDEVWFRGIRIKRLAPQH
jgi:hypothetical protein